MRLRFRVAFALCLACSAGVLAGCTDDSRLGLGAQCELNSECEAPLVCRLERCRNECTVSRDCPLGARCVVNNDGLGSCTLDEEDSCTGVEDCPDVLQCVVGSCRNACEGDGDCASDATCEPVDGRRACFGTDDRPDAGGGRDSGSGDAGTPDAGPTDAGGADGGGPTGVVGCDVDPGLPPCAGCTVVDVSAGGEHSCAVRSDGLVFCWGSNAAGQLGVVGADSPVPVEVPGVTTAVEVSAGREHTCARLEGGGLRCWGNDAAGQLGDGPSDSSGAGVVTVSGIGNAVSVSAGSQHTCAALDDGTARCWGADISLALGNGSRGDSDIPDPVEALAGAATSISAGDTHSCAASVGGVYCWGANQRGQLGDGTTDSRAQATRAMVLSSAEQIAVGASGISGHTCARLAGDVHCWGNNGFGELGDGTGDDSPVPVAVVGLPDDAVDVSTGPTNSCAVLASGELWCWGDNFTSALGRDGASTDSPERVGAIDAATRVSMGGAAAIRHVCAIVAGAVACWGSNSRGQLGAGLGAGTYANAHAVCGLD